MKRLLLLSPVLALAACAPAQGVPPTLYQAKSSEILAAIAQICPTVQPSGGYNFLSVTAVTPTVVTCAAGPVGGMAVLNALAGTRSEIASVTFTALENGNVTSVAGGAINATRVPVEKIFTALNQQFNRVSAR